MLRGIFQFFFALVAFAICGWSAPSSQAEDKYPAHLFALSEMHFDETREACGLDCMIRGRDLQDILVSVAGAMGINPAYLKAGLNMAYPPADKRGEEVYYQVPFVPGYKYCNTRIGITSLMSASDDPKRATSIDASVWNHLVGFQTWTGEPRPGEGQSSVEGYVVITGILPQYFDEFKRKGVCRDAPPPDQPRQIFKCKGNPCSGGQDGGALTTGSSTPALKTAPAGF